MNKQVLTASADTESKTSTSCSPTLSAADTQNTKICQAFRWKKIIRMLGVFLTLLDKWGHPQPGKPSIPSASRRPLSVQLLPWFYHGNSYWRDRANRNRPKVQERTLRHRSNDLCRVVWRPHWPFMQKHLVRPQFATGFQKAPFGRRTITAVLSFRQFSSASLSRFRMIFAVSCFSSGHGSFLLG